ncbi:MAG TPA: F0F1 ATP synthase subunit delta [Acidimicrobiales bacterium]|nr:F0F1 ATP synthase subunit delta [Acidimicrobiales bacterium]
MREFVRGYAAAVFETAQSAGRLDTARDDLVGFARALNASDKLRLVLTDPMNSTTTRRAIVAELLAGKATPETAALFSFAVRVERPAELPVCVAVLVELAEDECRRAASRVAVEMEPAAARGAIRERIRGYGERVFQELSAPRQMDEVEDELFAIARLIDANRSLRQTLGDANRPLSGRIAVVDDLFGSACHLPTVRMVRYVLRAGQVRDLVGTLGWLVELAAAERGRRVAAVRSAVVLRPAEKKRIGAALSRIVERDVEVRAIIDPTVIGGILVSVGDLVIDGTVRLRVERLRDLLAQTS